MFIRIKISPHNPKKKSVQIVESVRDGKKVKQRIIRHVGVALNDLELKKLKDLAEYIKVNIEHEHTPSLFSPEEVAEQAIASRNKSEQEKELKVDLKKLQEESRWDGICGIFTNCKNLSNEEIIGQYKGLWQVEESFRITKHDLKVRPIYHWTPERIKAHIAISFMAFSCVRLLEYRIKIQATKLSPMEIRHALSKIQLSILKDNNGERYVLPSTYTTIGKKIYQLIGLKPIATPYKLESSKPKFHR